MSFTPLHDRILVRRLTDDETFQGGIVIPDSAKEKSQEGGVVAAGDGKRLEDGSVRPLEVRDGDQVLFGKYAGTEIRLDGEDYLILREEEILAVTSGAARLVGARR